MVRFSAGHPGGTLSYGEEVKKTRGSLYNRALPVKKHAKIQKNNEVKNIKTPTGTLIGNNQNIVGPVI